jgi:PAS domain S-box-containing protein
MLGFGTFNWIAGVLQLVVPSYGLRLVRRFGTQRVGWFLVTAFACLAMLHLLEPLKPGQPWQRPDFTLDVIYAIGSVLLLIGMAHTETVCSERDQASKNEHRLRSQWDLQAKEESATLVKVNRKLLEEIACRAQNETSLKESEAQYRFLFMENPQPMWILDLLSGQFLAVNKAALREYGFTLQEFMALTARDLLAPAASAGFLEDIAKPCPEAVPRGVWQHCRKDRTLIDVEITALDLKYAGCPARLILAHNVSQSRRRELEQRQARKMEIIGRVSGGVAHQFNNIFSEIEGQTALWSRLLQNPETADQLKQISAAVTRGSALTRQLLAVGQKDSLKLEAVDLNGLLQNLSTPLRRLVGEHIVLQNNYGSFMLPVLADQRLLEHIIMNLVLNARDAMPRSGTLTISTATVRTDDTHAQGFSRAGAKEFVRLVVRDTGCGMTPEIQARLFEPFFTTKDPDKSIGLGLASVYGAVKQQSGWVEFSSEVGVGTEFKVFLPCAPTSTILLQTGSRAGTPLVRGTVMLVEPDDRMRVLARCILNWNGYRVVEADCSSAALSLWENEASNIDLLFADLDLPGDISGRDLADRLRKAKPGLKVVYSYASSSGKTGQDPVRLEGLKFIPKPFNAEKLLQEVQDCLNRDAEGK